MKKADLRNQMQKRIAQALSLIESGKFLIFCCYRPPDHSVDNFFNTLSSLLSTAESESATTILVGTSKRNIHPGIPTLQ